jgi:hypothetical protein
MTNKRPLLLGVDRYMLRACGRRDAPAVLVYGPNGRDAGLPALPAGVTTVFTEDERSPEAVVTALTRARLAGHWFADRVEVVPPILKPQDLKALQPDLGHGGGQLDPYSGKDPS